MHLVEISVMEQRYQAAMAVIQDGDSTGKLAAGPVETPSLESESGDSTTDRRRIRLFRDPRCRG